MKSQTCANRRNAEDEDSFRDAFGKLHTTYGNCVLFENAAQGDDSQEVLYHLSGCKVQATTTNEMAGGHEMVTQEKSDEKVTFEPKENSFTTARRAMAVVPGLEFISEKAKDD